jgi:hypothetical protein
VGGNLYGLAQDGNTKAKGMPNLLQAALFAGEFEDVLCEAAADGTEGPLRRPDAGRPAPGLHGQLP